MNLNQLFKLSTLKVIFILIFAGLLVYSISLRNEFVWDDSVQITDNPLVHSLKFLPQLFTSSTAFNSSTQSSLGAFYRPLQMTFYAILYTIFGSFPFIFHLVQISFHIGNSILLYYLIAYCVGKRPAFFASLIFLIHPIVNESVVFMSALSEVMCLFFGLLAFVVMIRNTLKNHNFLLVGFLLLLSAFSKETGLIFIPLVLLFRWLIQEKSMGLYWVSAILAGIVYGLFRISAGLHPYPPHSFPLIDLPLSQRLINVPSILWYYLKTVLFPKDLAVSQQWLVHSTGYPSFYIPLIIILISAALMILWIILVVRNNRKILPLILFFLFWSILGIGPYLQIIPLEMTVADRWFYLPFAGLIGLITTLIVDSQLNLKIHSALIYFTLLLVVIFSVRNMARSLNWYDNLSLFSHDIKISGDSANVENNLGFALYAANRKEEALPHFESATKLAPHSPLMLSNLGTVYYRLGKIDKAKYYYNEALKLDNVVTASEELAKLLLVNESPSASLEFTQRQLQKLPYNPTLWMLQAIAQYKLGMQTEALSSIKKSYELLPSEYSGKVYQVILNGGKINIERSQ